jgi:DNA helicase-2/ATP-dependent DNA helicase PcrA
MVIAGPGTGKTQLITTRVGYILQKTDAPPESILLLTFTEAGVQAMRDRLNHIIGKPAYDIQLSTYHAFGGEIFRRYPDYFEGVELMLLEELGADSLLREIIGKLPYSDPLKFADSYISDIKSFIGESKRALLSPEDIVTIADDNLKSIAKANKSFSSILSRLNVVSKKSVPAFKELNDKLSSFSNDNLPNNIQPLLKYAHAELAQAIEHFEQSGKTIQLSEWKRRWLARDESGSYVFDGKRINQRLMSAGRIYAKYQQALRKRHLYDYDDMIIRAIDALETNAELRYSLGDRYSYIMLDEFQDTNPAQFKLVQLLTDHPVHEGRPNILAVGDDDQAIYAFQGADHANMASFIRQYKEVRIISLKENYRSGADIIETSQNIVSQVQSRLVNQFERVTKQILPANVDAPNYIEAREFKSDAAQFDWVADEIKRLVKKGISPDEIAVLAPKHRFLEQLLPYLGRAELPVHYERRENVLDEPLVRQLEQMSKLVLALSMGDERLSNHLWPEVLSYDFWQVSVEKIWQISWQSRQSREPWTSLLLNDVQLKSIASFFIKLGSLLDILSLEQQIDAIIGVPGIADELKLPAASPMYEYYFSKEESGHNPLGFIKLISDLNVLRSRLRDWRRNNDEPLGLRALIHFIEGHRAANLNILNTSPYHEKADAVNLLTAYAAKGREFKTVFIIAAVDEVWGSASRNQGYRLSLPANISYIRYQGASEDERLRLLYVAATRAKERLYFTSYSQDLAGKRLSRLKYLDVVESGNDIKAKILPEKHQTIKLDNSDSIALAAASDYWAQKHLPPFKPELTEVLNPRLQSYKLSATDLRSFLDIVNGGPDNFFIKCLLRFPSAPSVTDSFGTAIHNTLKFAGRALVNEGRRLNQTELDDIFKAQLDRIDLPPHEFDNLTRRGHDSLRAWAAQRYKYLSANDLFEHNFQNEAARLGDVQLTGIADRMIIEEKRKTITVVDYKTGRAYQKWQPGIIKLHLYQLQLMFYKIMIENSARYKDYKVENSFIEFVEPDESGKIKLLEYRYDDDKVKHTQKLLCAVWQSILSLQFPDISGYTPTVAGIRQFEDDLAGISE